MQNTSSFNTTTTSAAAQVNEDEFNEILKKNKSMGKAPTSTPTPTSVQRNNARHLAREQKLNQQNKGLREMGLEPTSDFVKNIINNHSP